MTIAACYLSPEGVVFGADSTSTYPGPGGSDRHYNYAQKIFQVGGPESTLGITMWGLGGMGELSYRTLIAQFADDLAANPAATMQQVTDRFAARFWGEYSARFAADLQRAQALDAIPNRSQPEEEELLDLVGSRSGGFCLGGYLPANRTPCASEILYGPTQTAVSVPRALQIGQPEFWGCPNLIRRLIYGIDLNLYSMILASPHWTGTDQDLIALIRPFILSTPTTLPIREAIDWIHASVYATIKGMKFSQLAPVCGGPVEVAAITTDRPFRWVRHKKFAAAIEQGGWSDA